MEFIPMSQVTRCKETSEFISQVVVWLWYCIGERKSVCYVFCYCKFAKYRATYVALVKYPSEFCAQLLHPSLVVLSRVNQRLKQRQASIARVTVGSEEMADAAIKLNSGHNMPVLGLGVWRADPGVLHNVVLQALKLGYRHFDCAGLSFCLLYLTCAVYS